MGVPWKGCAFAQKIIIVHQRRITYAGQGKFLAKRGFALMFLRKPNMKMI